MIVCAAGVFGGRMHDVAERYGATVHLLEVPWGKVFEADQWKIDACYSAPQKCLSCPPGLAPVTISLPVLNAVHAAPGVDEAIVRRRLLDDFGIEIGAGLGPFRGKAWRIGLMGASSTRRNVALVLTALESILSDLGVGLPRGAAAAAAAEEYARAS